MSMISEQVKGLRKLANQWKHNDVAAFNLIFEACDTIEALSAKVRAADRPTGWIPIKWHEITDEEREREGYPKDWVVHIDCEMPCDEQEILIQAKKGYIRWDVCYEDDGFSLDSGWDWIEDIVAWMPLPEPYKGGDSDG